MTLDDVIRAHAGAWTLVGCTGSPGFDFAVFVMAPPAWSPGG